MSKIIKKGRLSDPATLETYQPPVLVQKNEEEIGGRSLEFMKRVREEIRDCQKRFSGYQTARKQRVETQVEKAYSSGYERGFEDGLNREKSDRIAAIDALLLEARRKREAAVGGMEVKVVELAVNMAEHIIGRTIEVNPDIVEDIIREVMANMIGGETVVLKVSEEDLVMVNDRYDQWLGMAGNVREFRIEADRRMRRGDCMVETEGGIIDAVISSRLECLVDKLLKR